MTAYTNRKVYQSVSYSFMFNQLVYVPRVIIAAYIGLTLILNIATPAEASSAGTTQAISAPEVYGGAEVEEGSAPWAVALVSSNVSNAYYGHFCGGTLIAKQWVLTAAHCTIYNNEAMTAEEIDVVAGTIKLHQSDLVPTVDGGSSSYKRTQVTEIIRHPSYDRTTAYADLALLKLSGSFENENYVPVAGLLTDELLRQWPSLLASGSEATVYGWGATEDHYRSNSLKGAIVPLVDNQTCQTSYDDEGYVVANGTLCAGYATGGQDACTGDSGGPLMVPNPLSTGNGPTSYVQIGIVSWGEGCAEAESYGVYTSVLDYIDWIESEIAAQASSNIITIPAVTVPVSGEAVVTASDTDSSETSVSGADSENRVVPAIFIPLVQ